VHGVVVLQTGNAGSSSTRPRRPPVGFEAAPPARTRSTPAAAAAVARMPRSVACLLIVRHRFGPNSSPNRALRVGKLGNVTRLPIDRRILVLAAAAFLLVLVCGKLLFRHGAAASPPPEAAAPVPVAPTTTERPPELVVDVVGAVRNPGLYRLDAGARVADALDRAGGATRRAALALVNLAAPVSDGQQIVVPRRGQAAAAAAAGAPAGDPAARSGPVHLNSATLEQLDSLPGVGPVTAQKILDYRQEHGSFTSVDDLDAIPGIGPARLAQLREAAAP
jgi:competence protein ComEA